MEAHTIRDLLKLGILMKIKCPSCGERQAECKLISHELTGIYINEFRMTCVCGHSEIREHYAGEMARGYEGCVCPICGRQSDEHKSFRQ